MRWILSIFFLSAAVGCAPVPAPSPVLRQGVPAERAPLASTAAQGSGQQIQAAQALGGPRMLVGRALNFKLVEDLIAPLPKQLSLEQVKAVGVTQRKPKARGEAQVESVWVVLDAQAPRPLMQVSTTLLALVDEDRELAPGWHDMTVFSEGPEGMVAQALGFQLDELPAHEEPPACLLMWPRGAQSGAAAEVIELFAAPVSDAVRTVEYGLVGSTGEIAVTATAGFTARVLELPSGDHQLFVRCRGGSGQVLAEARRVISVNRELAAPVAP